MAHFKKIAREIGLEDLGEATLGDKTHEACGSSLRFGKDPEGYTWSYCPNCRKRVVTILMPRFRPGIKVSPHED